MSNYAFSILKIFFLFNMDIINTYTKDYIKSIYKKYIYKTLIFLKVAINSSVSNKYREVKYELCFLMISVKWITFKTLFIKIKLANNTNHHIINNYEQISRPFLEEINIKGGSITEGAL